MKKASFHPAVAQWFESTFGSPTEPQQLSWPAIQSGAHTLLAAPTGSGKTLAAFLASLDQLFQAGLEGTLPDETRVLYVSPLKALSNDIHKNLEQPLAGIRRVLAATGAPEVPVRAEVRTGDTPAPARQRMLRRPPHILVTTPESFYVLLTSESGRGLLSTVRTLIVDEIHALVGNRRGSHLALSMERLDALVKRRVQRIGLSATQRPIEEVAKFLVGAGPTSHRGPPPCRIIDVGHVRAMDLAIEVPGSPLEAVMSHEVWAEIYDRLATLVREHKTTLVFVNTRRLAERITHHLAARLGRENVASHHGSLAAKIRLEAEQRLKRGELKVLVATASLELGIDIGSVDLVCQIGTPRSISTLLQRVGRAEHRRGGLPKGRVFPLSRDELVEVSATLLAQRQGGLDRIEIPAKPMDILAQQIVACAATEDWEEDKLFDLVRRAYPYRDLARDEFDEVLRMLADGFTTQRGRRAALVHHDAVNHRLRGRRAARLVALTSGGAIPETGDYRVLMEPGETFIGTVNEDFAVESLAGDIFQLGNASWRILRVNAGAVRVEDAHGQPPSIPFWLGEAPGRSVEVSEAVSHLRDAVQQKIEATLAVDDDPATPLTEWLQELIGCSGSAARQVADYFVAAHRVLGVIPSQRRLVIERFFDESGGMQLVIHSTFGIRVNRAWGLALRKRFCRSFNFELQAAALDDAIVLSLGTQHSFPLDEVFRYLHSRTVRDLLVQALLDAPMFPTRWRWNATRALALPRQRGGRKIPAPLQRMESENLLAAVFPDQLACLENIEGDREVPDHPLVRQTIEDCLTEAMDIHGLIRVLQGIESGEIPCVALDLPEPSPLAQEILNAKPYAYLDDAPIEERRTQAVYARRSGGSGDGALGILDPAAIEKVVAEAWPIATHPHEVHEALLLAGLMRDVDMDRLVAPSGAWRDSLMQAGRIGRLGTSPPFWIAAERLPMVAAVHPDAPVEPPLVPPEAERKRAWTREAALKELVRGRLEIMGPVTRAALAEYLAVREPEVEGALLALEAEGFVLRGKFSSANADLEWCDRRLLARIHRLTLHRLRAEIQPVSIADFQRFLLAWQRVDAAHRAQGPDGLEAVVRLLDGFEAPAGAWEPEILAMRVEHYTPDWLDQLSLTGRIGWGRLTPPRSASGQPFAPVRSSPIALFEREHLDSWLTLAGHVSPLEFSTDTVAVWQTLSAGGALFFDEIARRAGLLRTRVEEALGELTAHGKVTADGFQGLRALLVPQDKRASYGTSDHPRRHKSVPGLESAGRWSLLRPHDAEPQNGTSTAEPEPRDPALEVYARVLLRRYGVVFRRLLEREALPVSWFEMGRVYRRLEAQGEIRGGHFVSGVSGEQFALPEAIGLMRSIRRAEPKGEWITLSGADPLNLVGILTPGARLPAITATRLLLRDGYPVGALKGGQVMKFHENETDDSIEHRLRIGTLPFALRPYYH